MALAKSHVSVVRQHFQRTSMKLPAQLQLNFISLPGHGRGGGGGGGFYIFGPDHMTKMSAMPLSKNLRKVSAS